MEKDRKTGLHYRAIWYYKYEIAEGNLKGKRIAVFLDERLKADKEKDYLSRIEENDTQLLENFFKNQYRLGTIAVISDLEESGERIYNLLGKTEYTYYVKCAELRVNG
ncbi:MAG: hypothetical protein N2V78_08075 [Methanophagales archaeon]|nr:hypothetical protein [Methanophagales archaeon]